MKLDLRQRLDNDLSTWNRCARAYEEGVVLGHPDVCAYEAFEEDFLDALLLYLFRDARLRVRLFDIGCGSARLHLRYGMKVASATQGGASLFASDPLMASGLVRIDGLDFSEEMLDMARKKLERAGLLPRFADRVGLQRGSAFDLQDMPGEGIPLVVAVCNTVGVMQGPEGARQLFQAMRRAVESQDGIAVISAYRKEAIASHALGNYESTMNVSGQPHWLKPARFISRDLVPVPLELRRPFDTRPSIRVAVRNQCGEIIEECVLERDPEEVERVVSSGHIRTYWDYESYWYSMARFRRWMREFWDGLPHRHIAGRSLDGLRAIPAQLAVLDAGNRLGTFFARLGIRKGA